VRCGQGGRGRTRRGDPPAPDRERDQARQRLREEVSTLTTWRAARRAHSSGACWRIGTRRQALEDWSLARDAWAQRVRSRERSPGGPPRSAEPPIEPRRDDGQTRRPARCRALFEKVVEVRSRTLPDDDPTLQTARGSLAMTIAALGDLPGAQALAKKGGRGLLPARCPMTTRSAGRPIQPCHDDVQARRSDRRSLRCSRKWSRSCLARCGTTIPISRPRG
jgi:hypothetical protein